MSKEQDNTAEQDRAQLVAAMGDQLGKLFFELESRFFWACLNWQQFEELFESQEKVDLLNESAPVFFWSLQQILPDDLVLHIGRLTDPPRVAGKQTLSLEQLDGAFANLELRQQVCDALKVVREKTKSLRNYRNKRVAHNDQRVVFGEEVVPGVTRKEVKESLLAIHSLFQVVRQHHKLPAVSFNVIGALGGTPALLNCLKHGVRARREEGARWRNPSLSSDADD